MHPWLTGSIHWPSLTDPLNCGSPNATCLRIMAVYDNMSLSSISSSCSSLVVCFCVKMVPVYFLRVSVVVSISIVCVTLFVNVSSLLGQSEVNGDLTTSCLLSLEFIEKDMTVVFL